MPDEPPAESNSLETLQTSNITLAQCNDDTILEDTIDIELEEDYVDIKKKDTPTEYSINVSPLPEMYKKDKARATAKKLCTENYCIVIAIFFILIFGSALAVGLYFAVQQSETQYISNALAEFAENEAAKLQRTLDKTVKEVTEVRALMSTLGTNLSYSSFFSFTNIAGSLVNGLQAIQFSTIVQDNERDAFNAQLTQQYVSFLGNSTNLYIWNNINGTKRPALQASMYVAMTYTVPLYNNVAALGLNTYAIPANKAIIKKALATGNASVSDRVRLVQDPANQWSVIMYQPVRVVDTSSPKYNQYIGFAAGLFRIGEIVTATMTDSDMLVDVYVYDVLNQTTSSLSLLHPTNPKYTELDYNNTLALAAMSYYTQVTFGDRTWRVYFVPKSAFYALTAQPYKIIALVLTLFLAVVLCFVVLFMVKRAQYNVKMRKLLKQKARLLERILPASIVDRIQNGEKLIADIEDNISLLFLDVVGFTSYVSECEPLELVKTLDHIFMKIDAIITEMGLGKPRPQN